jgi:hypothetical protein
MTAEIGTKDRARRWTFGNDTGALAERAPSTGRRNRRWTRSVSNGS